MATLRNEIACFRRHNKNSLKSSQSAPCSPFHDTRCTRLPYWPRQREGNLLTREPAPHTCVKHLASGGDDSVPWTTHAAALGPDAIPLVGALQIFAFVGFLELAVMKDSANGAAPGDFPGDFRNGALDFGWDTFDEETKLTKRAVELNNGRAAMMGILGLMVHEKLGEIGMAADLPIIGVLQ